MEPTVVILPLFDEEPSLPVGDRLRQTTITRPLADGSDMAFEPVRPPLRRGRTAPDHRW
jgi:hypothetical protein